VEVIDTDKEAGYPSEPITPAIQALGCNSIMVAKPRGNQNRGIRIAVVDDHSSVRNAVSRLARSHGFECTAYDSGESVIAAPAMLDVDCLILDVQLSGMDGFETRDLLRARGFESAIIFITAHPELQSPEWQRLLKGSPCFSKPFEETDLIGAICRMLML
jgi:FixJ family two-component response regulator